MANEITPEIARAELERRRRIAIAQPVTPEMARAELDRRARVRNPLQQYVAGGAETAQTLANAIAFPPGRGQPGEAPPTFLQSLLNTGPIAEQAALEEPPSGEGFLAPSTGLRAMRNLGGASLAAIPFAGFGGTAAVRAAPGLQGLQQRMLSPTGTVPATVGAATGETIAEEFTDDPRLSVLGAVTGAAGPSLLTGARRVVTPQGARIAEDTAAEAFQRRTQRLGAKTPTSGGGFVRDALTLAKKEYQRDVIDPAYRRLDNLVRPDTIGDAQNTLEAIERVRSKGRLLGPSETLIGLLDDAIEESNRLGAGGRLTLQQMRDLRGQVGLHLDNKKVGKVISNLYNALRDDMRTLVNRRGGRTALNAFERADKLNTQFATDKKNIFDKIDKAGFTSDDVWRQGKKADFDRLNKILSTLGTQRERDIFASSILENMGRAGDQPFDPRLFFQNWNAQKNNADIRRLLGNATSDPDLMRAIDEINELTSTITGIRTEATGNLATMMEFGGARPLIRGGGGISNIGPTQFWALLDNPLARDILLRQRNQSLATIGGRAAIQGSAAESEPLPPTLGPMLNALR